MALSGEEIRANLTVFAAKWSVYDGGERSEAQTFLNELFDCYGSDRQAVARFEQRQGVTFVDAIWPRVCLIEMKAPSQTGKLATHRKQVLDYWVEAFGWPKSVAHDPDESNRRLLELNRAIAAGEVEYDPFRQR